MMPPLILNEQMARRADRCDRRRLAQRAYEARRTKALQEALAMFPETSRECRERLVLR